MIRLPCEIRRNLVIHPILAEGRITHIAPEHSRHAKGVRLMEGDRDFPDLPIGLRRAEIDGGTERDRAQFPGLADGSERDLVVLIRIREELVVIDLADERDPVCVLTSHGAEHPEGGGDRVAATLDGELYDLFS